jgi:hypothetical protein
MNCTNYFFVDHVAADCLSHSQADDLVPERFGATRQSAAAEAKTATNAGTISQLFDRAQQDLGPPGLDNVIYFMKVGKTMDEITDPIKAALIRRGLADEQMRAKLMRDLFSPNEQDRLRALESLRDSFGNK